MRHLLFSLQLADFLKYKDHHLTGFRIKTEQHKKRTVWVKNQFSKKWQKLAVEQPFELLVPSQKLEPKFHNAPKGLDHYLCYEVKGDSMAIRVALKDQFQGYDYMPTGTPVVLCNPVKKTHRDKVFPIKKKKWHLVGYQLTYPLEQTLPATANNQFGKFSIFQYTKTTSPRIEQLDALDTRLHLTLQIQYD